MQVPWVLGTAGAVARAVHNAYRIIVAYGYEKMIHNRWDEHTNLYIHAAEFQVLTNDHWIGRGDLPAFSGAACDLDGAGLDIRS